MPIGEYKNFNAFVKHLEKDQHYSHKSAVKIAGKIEASIRKKRLCEACGQIKGSNVICHKCIINNLI